jgi:hypothetical protein
MAEPLFRRAEAGVDERLGEIELPSIAEILRQAREQSTEQPGALPGLKASVTRLVRRIATREVVPGRAGAEHPQHAVHHGARVLPGATAPIGTTTRPKGRFQDLPLGVRQVHTSDVRRTS